MENYIDEQGDLRYRKSEDSVDDIDRLKKERKEIMKKFDFAKVMKCMHLVDWKLNGKKVTEFQLRETAYDLMNGVIKDYPKSKSSHSTGGFQAELGNESETETDILYLSFTLEWQCALY